LIDYFLVRKHRAIMDVKAIPSESLDTDHRLVAMKTRIVPLKTKPISNVKRINTAAMNDEGNKIKFFLILINPRTTE